MIEDLKRKHAIITEAIRIMQPYDGIQVSRFGAKKADAYRSACEALEKIPGAVGYIMSFWLFDAPTTRVTTVNLAGAREQLERLNKAIDAWNKWSAHPAVMRVCEAEQALKKVWGDMRSELGDVGYANAMRAGVFPRVSWY